MRYATVSDVAIDAGDAALDPAIFDKVETLLDRAESQLLRVFPDLDARIVSGRISIVLVKQVLSEMVATVLSNPEGLRSRTEAVGPFSVTTGFGGSFTTGADPGFGKLVVTDRHKALLSDYVPRRMYNLSLGGA